MTERTALSQSQGVTSSTTSLAASTSTTSGAAVSHSLPAPVPPVVQPAAATRTGIALRPRRRATKSRGTRRTAAPSKARPPTPIPEGLVDVTPLLDILQPGEQGPLPDREVWLSKFGHGVVELLMREGTLSQGDCGPASGHRITVGSVADPRAALKVRQAVIAYGRSPAGRAYYSNCQQHCTEQVPGVLELVLSDESEEKAVTSHEWFTLFGGLHQLNVFVFTRFSNLAASDGDRVTSGIQLVTNGGTLVESDEANTIAVFFQGGKHEVKETLGHWEVLLASDGVSGVMWRYDHPIVDALKTAMQHQHLRTTRVAAIRKQLRASSSRADGRNQVIDQGDCVWLTVPMQVVAAVRNNLRHHDERRHCEGKMLCKVVALIGRWDPSSLSAPSVSYRLLSPSGVLANPVSIDQLSRCHPPPVDEPVTIMALPNEAASRKKRVTLTMAYKEYTQWRSTRTASLQLGAAAAAPDLHNTSSGPATRTATAAAAAQATAASSTITFADSSASDPDGEQAATGTTGSRSDLAESTAAASASAGGPMVSAESPVQGRQVVPYHRTAMPCVLCKRTRTFEERTSCAYDRCRAPLCKQATGCNGRALAIGKLLYCRASCASLDGSSSSSSSYGKAAVSSTPGPVVPSPTTQPAPSTSRRVAVTASPPERRQQQQLQASAAINCATCGASLQQASRRASCDECRSYICKPPKGVREGCTVGGWTGGGTMRLDGLLHCISCRFAADPSWIAFTETTEYLAHQATATRAAVIALDDSDAPSPSS